MQSVNSAQFLNITPLFLSSNRFVASSSAGDPLVTFIVPLTRQVYMHHYNHINWFRIAVYSSLEF